MRIGLHVRKAAWNNGVLGPSALSINSLMIDNTIIKESMPCHVSQWQRHSGTVLMSRLARQGTMPDAGMPASSTARHRAAAAAASAAFKVYMNSPLIWNSLSVVDDNRHTVTCKL